MRNLGACTYASREIASDPRHAVSASLLLAIPGTPDILGVNNTSKTLRTQKNIDQDSAKEAMRKLVISSAFSSLENLSDFQSTGTKCAKSRKITHGNDPGRSVSLQWSTKHGAPFHAGLNYSLRNLDPDLC